MGQPQMIFQRYEIKYLLEEGTYLTLQKRLEDKVRADRYGKATVCNIYFDTPDYRIIRASMEKPVYKEKLRLRSYNIPESGSRVYVELKKKFRGVVYKRREGMSLGEAEAYLYETRHPQITSQVIEEVDWFLKYYREVIPSMYIAYDRIAVCGVREPELRITFDSDIRWRREEMRLEIGDWGEPILKPGQRLMEIKMGSAMPLWLSGLLDELGVYPASFSKYGRAYQERLTKLTTEKGGECCA